MKRTKLFIVFTLATVFSVIYTSCIDSANANVANTTQELNSSLVWHDFSELDKLQKQEPRKVLVDVYTDWCKWCKVMDQKTFNDEDTKSYLNKNYYLVKLNAENKNTIEFKNQEYNFIASGRRGYNQLAAELCQDKLSYPSLVLLDEDLNRKRVARGYQTPEQLMQFLSES